MKITAIVGAISGNDYNCSGILNIIYKTMQEIGESVNVIDLSAENLPYCTGSFIQGNFSSIEKEINSSDGIIIITTSNLFAPCAIMQNFLEHLSQPIYKNTLKNKNCMIVAISNMQDVSGSINYLSKVVTYLGGYDSIKVPLNYSITKNLSKDDTMLIEKYTEDFYRYVKQNRKFFTSNFSSAKIGTGLVQPAGGVFQKPATNSEIVQAPVLENNNADNFAHQNQYGIDGFHKAQENDILEITKSLSGRMSKPVEAKRVLPYAQSSSTSYEQNINQHQSDFGINNIFNNELTEFNINNISPTTLNAKQMTQKMMHYFQPQLSDGLICNISLNISGLEGFEGVISINQINCDFIDGQMPNPDVIVSANDDIWKQIVRGTISTQKAFMTGQIKVRGNFVLLTKFDSLFKR